MRFLKGHGTENDFVVLPDPDGRLALTPALVRRLCDRRAGLGGDGVLRVVPTALEPDGARWADQAQWFMDYRNADGSVAEMCGNGVRVFVAYLERLRRVGQPLLDEVAGEDPDAVAAHLGDRAVGVAVVHEPPRLVGVRRTVDDQLGGHDAQDAVGTDARAPVADPSYDVIGQLHPALGVGQHDEVVLGAVPLEVAQAGSHTDEPTTGQPLTAVVVAADRDGVLVSLTVTVRVPPPLPKVTVSVQVAPVHDTGAGTVSALPLVLRACTAR